MTRTKYLLVAAALIIAAVSVVMLTFSLADRTVVANNVLGISSLFFLAVLMAYWSFQYHSVPILGGLVLYCINLIAPVPVNTQRAVYVIALGLFVWGLIRDGWGDARLSSETQSAEPQYRMVFENSAVGITVADTNEHLISWNRYTEQLLDMTADDLLMRPVRSLYPPEEWAKIRLYNVRRRGMQHHLETRMVKGNGELIDVDISLSILRDADGTIQGSIGIIRDITDRKQAEARLAESEEKYRVLIESSVQPVAVVQVGKIQYVNPAFATSLRYDDTNELIGCKFLDLVVPEDRAQQWWLSGCIDPDGISRRTLRLLTKTGQMRWYEVQATDIRYKNHAALLIAGQDITKTKTLLEEISQQLLRDALTGVYNRRYFNETIMQEIKRADRYGHHTSFIMGDVDHLKIINDTYGHLVGDQVLQGVAQALESSVRAADMVVRYGGDEFLVVLPQTGEDQAQAVVSRIQDNFADWLAEQVQMGSLDCDVPAQVGFSMGIASCPPGDEVAVEEVLNRADEEMYRVKQAKCAGQPAVAGPTEAER